MTWVKRLARSCPITSLSQELVRFDTQLLQNAEMTGIAYQQGELAGYEVREYLLEKWHRMCAYCGAKAVALEVEHIVPKVRGGSNRVSNLTLACVPCNQKKGRQTAAEFGSPKLQAQAKLPLKDAAAVNATRWALYHALKATGLPVETGTGGRTKYNRTRLGLAKSHWADAACVGASTPGTMVPKGKYVGTWISRVVVKARGYFDVVIHDKKASVHQQYCTRLWSSDGYMYTLPAVAGTAVPPPAEARGLHSGIFRRRRHDALFPCLAEAACHAERMEWPGASEPERCPRPEPGPKQYGAAHALCVCSSGIYE